VLLVREPVKPVKLRFFVFPVTPNTPELAVMLKLILFASVVPVLLFIVSAVDEELVTLITGVPVTVIVVEPVKMVAVPAMVIVLVPKAKVPVKLAKLRLKQFPVVPKVTVPEPEFASKKTTSEVVGTA
jgi:hypothetical protein